MSRIRRLFVCHLLQQDIASQLNMQAPDRLDLAARFSSSLTVQDLLHEVDAARVTAWDAGTRRAALAHEAGLAEEQAAVAKRRIPELEAEKKAAAAARVSCPGLPVHQAHAAEGTVVGCSSRQGELFLRPGQKGRGVPVDYDAYGPGGR